MRSFRFFPPVAVALVAAAQLSSSVLAAQTPEPDPTVVTRLAAAGAATSYSALRNGLQDVSLPWRCSAQDSCVT